MPSKSRPIDRRAGASSGSELRERCRLSDADDLAQRYSTVFLASDAGEQTK
jgi:hypothetical protein